MSVFSLNGCGNPFVKNELLSNLFGTLCFIRKKALEAGVTADEYFMSLFLYSLATLKFSNISNHKQHPAVPFPKIVAYIAAPALSKRIDRILFDLNNSSEH
jgi:hypothetical protein